MSRKKTGTPKAKPAAKPVVKKDLPGIKTDIGGQQPNPGSNVGSAQGNENPGAGKATTPTVPTTGADEKNSGTPGPQVPPAGPVINGDPGTEENPHTVPQSGTEDGVQENKPSEDTAPKPEPYDHTGKIKITDVEYDKVDGKRLKKLVKESHINQHYKDNLNRQIKAGQISPEYVNMVRMIISADDKGSVYSGTLEG